MLKGIEMLPARFLEVMSLVQRTAKKGTDIQILCRQTTQASTR